MRGGGSDGGGGGVAVGEGVNSGEPEREKKASELESSDLAVWKEPSALVSLPIVTGRGRAFGRSADFLCCEVKGSVKGDVEPFHWTFAEIR